MFIKYKVFERPNILESWMFVYFALVCLTLYSEDLVALKQWIGNVKCSSWPSEGLNNKTFFIFFAQTDNRMKASRLFFL
jgi:hypothetical protein